MVRQKMRMLSLVVCQSLQMDYMMLHIDNPMVWLQQEQQAFSKTKTETEKFIIKSSNNN